MATVCVGQSRQVLHDVTLPKACKAFAFDSATLLSAFTNSNDVFISQTLRNIPDQFRFDYVLPHQPFGQVLGLYFCHGSNCKLLGVHTTTTFCTYYVTYEAGVVRSQLLSSITDERRTQWQAVCWHPSANVLACLSQVCRPTAEGYPSEQAPSLVLMHF